MQWFYGRGGSVGGGGGCGTERRGDDVVVVCGEERDGVYDEFDEEEFRRVLRGCGEVYVEGGGGGGGGTNDGYGGGYGFSFRLDDGRPRHDDEKAEEEEVSRRSVCSAGSSHNPPCGF